MLKIYCVIKFQQAIVDTYALASFFKKTSGGGLLVSAGLFKGFPLPPKPPAA